MIRSRYEVYQAADGWRWKLRAANSEIVAQSEGYTREADAWRGARDARKVSRFAKIRGEE